MKKILAVLLALALVIPFASCDKTNDENTGDDTNVVDTNNENEEENNEDASDADEVKVMTYAEYVAAELDTEVVVEAYVQGTQSWWEKNGQGVITVYTQDKDGAYFIYEMKCSEEDSAKLVPGAKIRITGFKGAWEGEVEIMDATFEFAGEDTFVAEAIDLTEKLGTEELINYQNQLATFKGLTVKSISFKDDEWDKDIYVDLTYNDATYSFCVENYLTGPDTDVYKTVAALEAGDIVDVEGFVYWYKGVNTHITAVTVIDEL